MKIKLRSEFINVKLLKISIKTYSKIGVLRQYTNNKNNEACFYCIQKISLFLRRKYVIGIYY